MVDTGIIRKIDDLGRVCIPREVRQRIFGKMDATGQELSFFVEGNSIILKPYKRTEQIYREKVIDEFVEKMKWEYDNSIGVPKKEINFAKAVVEQVAERLKGN